MTNAPMPTRSRGVALIMVITVLAMTAVLGFAMLNSAALAARSSANAAAAVSAAALAESGVELACVHILNPSQAPGGAGPAGFWDGHSGMTIAGVPGTLDVQVTDLGSGNFRVTSTASVPSGGGVITRTATADLRVQTGYTVRHAAAFAGAPTLTANTTVNGNVQTGGQANVKGTINGQLVTPVAPIVTGTIRDGWTTPGADTTTVPPASRVRDYSRYDFAGGTYDATLLGTSLPNNTVLGPTASNPAGVYLAPGDLAVYNDVKVNGTLIVNGFLNVLGGRTEITPASGFPAAVLKKDIYLRGPGTVRDVTFNGLTWLGGAVRSSGSVSTGFFQFNGAVLFGGAGSVDTFFGGAVRINSQPALSAGVELDTAGSPRGVKITRFR